MPIRNPNPQAGARRRALLAAACAAVAATLAACSSGAGSTGAAANSASAAATAAAAGSADGSLATARAAVSQLTNPASPLFDYKKAIPTIKVAPKKGERIAVVTAALSSPVVKQYADSVVAAADLAGYQATEFDGKFDVSTMASLVQQAVQQKYNGIVLVGVVPDTVSSPLAAAKSAGIPVVAYDGYGDSGNGVTDVGVDPIALGTAVAQWIIADSGGKAKVLAVTFSSGASGGPKSITNVAQQQLVATLKQCSGCTVHVADTTIADVVAPGSPQYVATLRTYPKGSIGYVASGCDSCMTNFGMVDTQLGETGLKVAGAVSTSVRGISEIESGTNGAMVAPVNPAGFIGLMTIDTMARRLAGMTVNPVRLICPLAVQSNAKDFPTASFETTSYTKVLAALWSVAAG
jgi:ABC-type sugar transport system substrate-binding protein